MAIVKKISELTPKGSNLANNDLLIVGVSNGTDYDLKSVTGAQVLGTMVTQTITDGVISTAPSENAVFDALATKVDKVTGSRLITSAEATILSNTSGTNTGDQDLSSYVNITTSQSIAGEKTFASNLTLNSGLRIKHGTTNYSIGYTGIGASDNSLIIGNQVGINERQRTLTFPTDANHTYTFPSLDGTLSLTSDLNTKVDANTAITGATKTKISYDAKGLVLSGADATTADIADSLNKRYVTDANLTTIGNTSGTNTGDQTFLDARVQSVTSSATVTPTNLNDFVKITAQATGLTLANPTGTFSEGQALMIRIKDNGTARTIAFDTNYRAIGVTLPTTTVISKTLYLGIIYNSTDAKWDVIGYNIQA